MKKTKFEIPTSVQAELDARDAKQEKVTVEALENGVFKLKYPWVNDKRGVPNAFLRSALFGVVRRGRREYLENVEIASWGDSCIRYTGAKLMQSDQDVWMACVEACKRAGRTNVIITQRELCKLAGKDDNKKWILGTLNRLSANTVTLEDERYTYMGSLIHEACKDKETGHVSLSVNPKMLSLFGAGATHIETEQRHALSGDLSKWLQGYVLSHKTSSKSPHVVSLDKLQKLCGAQSDFRKFKFNIRKSIKELKTLKIIAGWKLENDVLKFWR